MGSSNALLKLPEAILRLYRSMLSATMEEFIPMRIPISVPIDYHCPFCPDHTDTWFYASRFIGQPICDVCMIELDAFADVEPVRDDFLITAVEHYTGLPWRACQCMLLHDHRQHWVRMRQAPPRWFMQGTSEQPPSTEAEAIVQIDSYIQDIEQRVRQFEHHLAASALWKVETYRTFGNLLRLPQ